MKKKLNCILLIDDDDSTNYLHQLILKKVDCTEKVIVMENGLDAIDYLKSKTDETHPRPDLIFLDINMPVMDGWEFIEEYEKLDEEQRGKIVVMMLTTSLNPDDEIKAKSIKVINSFGNKPLNFEMMQEILELHFKDYF